ncbi:cellulose binding domain-containing protein, partial [Streptomyces triticisoli]|uniref:cellulose binding domain-containing protein n=1 Tax=Streptomyces triticisoli TaxID=2182797 RepID=UPI0018E52D74
ADVRLGTRRPEPAHTGGGEPAEGTARARVVRGSLLAAAVVLSGLALVVSMMPFGGSTEDTARGDAGTLPVADSGLSLPADGPSPSTSVSASAPGSTSTSASASHTPSVSGTATRAGRGNPDPEPQGTSTATAEGGGTPGAPGTPGPYPSAPAVCQVRYDLTNQWTDGFQAAVTVTTARSLDTWRVAWSFRDGQRVAHMWDASVAQHGSRVTATAADYNKPVAAGGTLSFGFIGTWQGSNTTPYGFTLNGHSCAAA